MKQEISETEARDRLKRFVEADSFPILTESDINYLISRAKRVDQHGRYPNDAEWTPTFDVESVVSIGWKQKAGRVAGNFRFSTSSQSFDRQQVFDHCTRMANQWAHSSTIRMHRD